MQKFELGGCALGQRAYFQRGILVGQKKNRLWTLSINHPNRFVVSSMQENPICSLGRPFYLRCLIKCFERGQQVCQNCQELD